MSNNNNNNKSSTCPSKSASGSECSASNCDARIRARLCSIRPALGDSYDAVFAYAHAMLLEKGFKCSAEALPAADKDGIIRATYTCDYPCEAAPAAAAGAGAMSKHAPAAAAAGAGAGAGAGESDFKEGTGGKLTVSDDAAGPLFPVLHDAAGHVVPLKHRRDRSASARATLLVEARKDKDKGCLFLAIEPETHAARTEKLVAHTPKKEQQQDGAGAGAGVGSFYYSAYSSSSASSRGVSAEGSDARTQAAYPVAEYCAQNADWPSVFRAGANAAVCDPLFARAMPQSVALCRDLWKQSVEPAIPKQAPQPPALFGTRAGGVVDRIAQTLF